MKAPDSPAADWRLAAVVIFLIWTVLFFWGQPLSFVDDLYFIGPAINLAAGHGFYNPYCPAIATLDPQKEFFVYTPLHSYVLAGWLWLFGVSRHSLALFQCLASALATLGLWRATSGSCRSLLYPVGMTLCVAVYLGSIGLRPEALGLALFAWGLPLLQSRSPLVWFLSSLSLAASAITSPNVIAVIPLVLGYALWRQSRRDLMLKIALAALAGALIFALFLWMIDGQLLRFLAVFNAARKIGSEGQNSFLQNLHGVFTSGRAQLRLLFQAALPFLEIVAAFGIALLRPDLFRVKLASVPLLLALLGGLLLYFSALSSATGLRLPGFYAVAATLLLVSCLRSPWRLAGSLYWALAFTLFVFSIGHRSLQLALLPLTPSSTDPAALRAQIASLHPDHLYVDEFALNVVYDYRLPPNATDYHFTLPGHMLGVGAGDFPAGSTMVMSREILLQGGFLQGGAAGQGLRPIPLVGALFPLEIANPYDCAVLQTPLSASGR